MFDYNQRSIWRNRRFEFIKFWSIKNVEGCDGKLNQSKSFKKCKIDKNENK